MSNQLTRLAEPTHFAPESETRPSADFSRPEGGALRQYAVWYVEKYEVTWRFITPDGRAGCQTFVVAAASHSEALGEALREARTERAVMHRQGAKIDPYGAKVAHLEPLL